MRHGRRWLAGFLIAAFLGVVALVLFPEFVFVVGWFIVFGVLSALPFAWQSVSIPLPDELGTMTYAQLRSNPFLVEYSRRISVRPANSRSFSSPIMANTGSKTSLLLFHIPAADGRSPIIVLQDEYGVTWVDVERRCLEDTDKSEDIPGRLQCDDPPLDSPGDWHYFGRIATGYDGIRFQAGEPWPPRAAADIGIASPRFALADTGWDFEIALRPLPGQQGPDYQITLRRGSEIVNAWFDPDRFAGSYTTLFWYPEVGGRGPYLLVGRFDGVGDTSDSTLVDLGALRPYRAYHNLDDRFPRVGPRAEVTGMDLQTSNQRHLSMYGVRDGVFSVQSEPGEVARTIPPLPEVVRTTEPRVLGVIDLEKMTFTTAVPRSD